MKKQNKKKNIGEIKLMNQKKDKENQIKNNPNLYFIMKKKELNGVKKKIILCNKKWNCKINYLDWKRKKNYYLKRMKK